MFWQHSLSNFAGVVSNFSIWTNPVPIGEVAFQVTLQMSAISLTCFTKILQTRKYMKPRAEDNTNTALDSQNCGLRYQIARAGGFDAENGGI